MNDRIDHAFVALAAAITARRLYGPDHRAGAETLRRAHMEFELVLAEVPSLEFHFLEGRVVGPSGVVSCDAASADAIRIPVAGRGAASIRFQRGVTEPELGGFLGVLEGTGGDVGADHPRIELGSTELTSASFGSERSTPTTAQSIASNLREAILVATPAQPIDTERLEGIAGSICAALKAAQGTMLRLASLKSHDEYTFMHTVNVAMLAASLAEACGVSADHVHHITLAALMHDLGKRDVPMSILGKGGPLDEHERRIMQQHPICGARILIGRPGVPDVAAIVAYEHHMHIDGTGYPDRVRGCRPHLASLIVQQADVYDALRTHRPYRTAMTEKEACDVLISGTESRYDRALVQTFIQHVASRIEEHPTITSDDPPARKAG